LRNPRERTSANPDLPVVLVKWYDDAKWVLEGVESFPKSQRFSDVFDT
jgi:hypothetical protein